MAPQPDPFDVKIEKLKADCERMTKRLPEYRKEIARILDGLVKGEPTDEKKHPLSN